ncbi:hypothetical protein SLS53_007274 [Cytospora paraplurivora]|uniref:Zeta toxin domain-containing protein n=1 Tax=Cytospora paraplurivora TaxID=2898453 RepID=A0AAN9YDX4_9PEZI
MTTSTKDFARLSIDPQAYILPVAVNQKIFDETIIPAELSHLKNAGHLEDGVQPIAILIAGQTGAGKTRIASAVWDAINTRNPAHFIADAYKNYHPEYTSLLKSTPSLASPATGTDAQKWLAMASNWCIGRKIDVLFESSCRNLDELTGLVSAFHSGGYRLYVVLLAVPECLSLLGILARHYKRLSQAQPGDLPLRLTPRSVHFETYDELLTVADFIDRSKAADDVLVVRPAAALASLDLERTRPLLEDEHSTFFADIQWVHERAGKDDVTEATLEDIEASLAALNSTGGRLSLSFPALQPLDVERWLFRK